MSRHLSWRGTTNNGETMILSSYRFGDLLKEEYQKLEMYARKQGMYCNIFFPGSAVCRCGKNLYVPLDSKFLTRDLVGVGESTPLEVSVRKDRPHSGVNEEHINTSAMFAGNDNDAFKKEPFHVLKLRKYGVIESEK